MNAKRTRSLLWLTTLVLTAGAGGIVALHVNRPANIRNLPDHKTSGQALDQSPIDAAPAPPRPTPDPQDLLALADRDLRQRLFDPPKVEPPPPKPKPVPPVQLISTILPTGGEPSAWIRDGRNTRKILIGDTVGSDNNPATVADITADQVVLNHEGRQAIVAREQGGGRR